MYLGHFGLREPPFSNTPDTRFVYLGACHEKALAHLLYGVQERDAFVHLTGEVGHGKTTVCRLLLDRLPEGVDVALIVKPVLTTDDLLSTVCHELRVQYEGDAPTRPMLVDALYRYLLGAHARKRRTVLIVDEAQDLGVGALGQLRLLMNLETDKQKLVQVILIGQPGLVDLLGRKELHRLSPRITSGYHLLPFAEPETCAYVRHRLARAGAAWDIFEDRALRAVHRLSGGVPRLINVICDRALLGAYARRLARVDEPTVRAAAREVRPGSSLQAPSPVEEDRRAPEPVVATVPPRRRMVTAPAARPLWPWLVGGGLAMNALVIGAMFVVTRPSGVAVVAPPPPAAEKAAGPAEAEAPTVQAPMVQAPALEIPQPPAPARPTSPAQAQPITPALAMTPAPAAAPAQTSARRRRLRSQPGELGPAGEQASASEQVPTTTPPTLDDARETLKIDMLVWAADPKERMVYVNGRKYVEGQALENGAVIERIAENGVVLVHQGQRIRLPSEAR